VAVSTIATVAIAENSSNIANAMESLHLARDIAIAAECRSHLPPVRDRLLVHFDQENQNLCVWKMYNPQPDTLRLGWVAHVHV